MPRNYSGMSIHTRKETFFSRCPKIILVSALGTISSAAVIRQPWINTNPFFPRCFFQYELLFCIQDVDDNRLRMYVESLKAKFPAVDCQVRQKRNTSYVLGVPGQY